MAKILAWYYCGSSINRCVTVSDGSNEGPDEGAWVDIPSNQELMLFPDFLSFAMLNDIGGYLLEIWVSDEVVELDLNPQRAFLIPFMISDASSIYVTDIYGAHQVPMRPGQYKLLIQDRFLTDDELKLTNAFSEDIYLANIPPLPTDEPNWWDRERNRSRPDLIRLTFFPTTEVVKAVWLREDYQERNQELILSSY